MASAMVTNIQGYSIHDGPGIRTVVFLKGCPLRCRWCANPENLEASVQIGFLRNLCTGCARCAKVCPNGAILPGAEQRIDRHTCQRCGACVKACYYGALVSYGEEKTAEAVFDKVRRDKMFYDSSNGGVTVSGGEPLTQPEFVAALFALCRGDGIGTCVETCGCVPPASVALVAPFTDLFYFDLKLMDPALHKKYTGSDNALIQANARYLASAGAHILFRQPLIPGITDTVENVRASAAFIKSLGREDLGLQLMPYHRMGTAKYAALDKPYTLDALQVMSASEIAAVEALYKRLGVDCTVSR